MITEKQIKNLRAAITDCLAEVAADNLNPSINELIDAAEAASNQEQAKPIEEIVRVTRIYVFEGPRKKVEDQMARSLGNGTRIVGSGIKIHVATIGSVPEILPMTAAETHFGPNGKTLGDFPQPILQPLGGHLVYVCAENWAGRIREEYGIALQLGATAIVIPTSAKGTASNLYTIEQFRKTWGYTIEPKQASPDQAPQEPPAGETISTEYGAV